MTRSPAGLMKECAWWLFITGLMLYMLLSAQALNVLGISYEAPGGMFFEKMHPGTWLIACSCVLLLVAHGNPLGVAASLLRSRPLLAIYAACQVFVLGWTLSRHGASGAAFMIDTLIMPAICVFTLAMIDSRRYYTCLVVILTILIINTLIALVETLLQARLIPMHISGFEQIVEETFRPSALLGHPLTNSIVTVTLMPAVLYLRIPKAWQSVLLLLLWVGALAFGGRTGFILATALYGTYFFARVVSTAVRGGFSYLQITGGLLAAIVVAACVVAIVMASPIGERIFKTLTWDASAEVRSQVWDVLNYLSPENMLMGVSPAEITKLGERIGLGSSEAIENFWLVMFLQFGWIGFIPFLVAISCVFAWLWRSSRGAMRVAVILFFAVASSNNSLATKTIAFVMLLVTVELTRRLRVSASAAIPRWGSSQAERQHRHTQAQRRDGRRRALRRP